MADFIYDYNVETTYWSPHMRFTLVLLFFAFVSSAYAQSSAEGERKVSRAPGQASHVVAGEGLPMTNQSHGGRHRDGTGLSTESMVSSIGFGQNLVYNMIRTGQTSMLLRGGATVLSDGIRSNIEGQSVMATVVPVYAGARYDWGVTRTDLFEWRQYAICGAGPVMGVEFPEAIGVWETLGKLGFRWGAGAFAGIGSELRFSEGITLSAQLELDAIGFLSPLVNRRSLLGPSFSIGFDFAP